MNRTRLVPGLALSLLPLTLASGVVGAAYAAAPTPAAVIPLYAGTAPGSEGATQKEVRSRLFGEDRVRNVTRPMLAVYLPEKDKATGTGVVVAPGGGFMMLSIESEGEQVAQFLNSHGIAAFVLTYRLNATPADPAEYQAQLMKLMQPGNKPVTSIDQTTGAQQGIADGLAAMKLMRSHAAKYGVAPGRLGIVGFSAGGMVAMSVATRYDAASRPDFVGSIYGALPEGNVVPADAPPVFLAVAADDPLLANASAPIFTAWQAKGRSAELHIFNKGGHGFGMLQHGNSSDHWADEFFWWLQAQGLAEPTHGQ